MGSMTLIVDGAKVAEARHVPGVEGQFPPGFNVTLCFSDYRFSFPYQNLSMMIWKTGDMLDGELRMTWARDEGSINPKMIFRLYRASTQILEETTTPLDEWDDFAWNVHNYAKGAGIGRVDGRNTWTREG